MDIERLKELKDQIKGVHDGINGDDFKLLYDLLPLVNEAIARQSATSEDVQKAIDILIDWDNENFEDRSVGIYIDSDMKFAVPLAITALQAYQPTTQKDRMLEEVAISQTETTKVKTVEIPAPREILKGDWGGK